jgi:chitinase
MRSRSGQTGLMMRSVLGVLACLVPTLVAASSAAEGCRVVAYVAGWSMPAVIHAEKLTHINFAFAHIDAGGRVAFDAPEAAAASLGTLLALKKQNPRLKVLVSVGGWQAEGFSDAAFTDASRATFAQSAVALLRRYSLDGVDIDWEYPGQGVAGIKYRPEDKRNFTLLLQTLRKHLGDRYLLTIASADREYFDHTEMDKLHVHLDWINVMTYDFFNSLTPTTGHHAGLYASAYAAPADRNADAAIRQHLAAGIPSRKLVLGAAFYGRSFAGVAPTHMGLNQAYGRYDSEHSYAELADQFIGKQGFVRYWDEHAQAPYLWNAASRTFITYDDPQSIIGKVRYVREKRLGGLMFWELSQDRDGALLDVIARERRSSCDPRPEARRQ